MIQRYFSRTWKADLLNNAVYALYNQEKAILWLLSLLFVTEIASMLTVLAFTIPKFEFTAQCLIIFAPKTFMGYWYVDHFETM